MKNLNDMIKDFTAATSGLEKLTDNSPRIFGTLAVKNIKRNFGWQSYYDGLNYTTWQARKASTQIAYSQNRGKGGNSRYKGSVFNASNPILQQTRNLYNALQFEVRSGKKVFIGVNLDLVPYAIAHNEGLNHQPKRQFMPVNDANLGMIKEYNEKVQVEKDKIFRNFR